jgi:hypothetical protein
MNVRRRVAMLERTVHSSGSSGRTWNGGYGAYMPAMVGKLLDIFRVVHNIKTKSNGKTVITRTTPAKELGLAKAILDFKDILYYE